ncbi:Cyclin-U4-1 [Diplonema papillatum]|nr:Cyclin-U4-1 [Diplonema papillatum]
MTRLRRRAEVLGCAGLASEVAQLVLQWFKSDSEADAKGAFEVASDYDASSECLTAAETSDGSAEALTNSSFESITSAGLVARVAEPGPFPEDSDSEGERLPREDSTLAPSDCQLVATDDSASESAASPASLLLVFDSTKDSETLAPSEQVLQDVLLRWVRASRFTKECLPTVSILLSRFIAAGGSVTFRNAHHVVLTLLVLATKCVNDRIFTNSSYARAAGVPLEHLNNMERVMLGLLDWDLFFTVAEYRKAEERLNALGNNRLGWSQQRVVCYKVTKDGSHPVRVPSAAVLAGSVRDRVESGSSVSSTLPSTIESPSSVSSGKSSRHSLRALLSNSFLASKSGKHSLACFPSFSFSGRSAEADTTPDSLAVSKNVPAAAEPLPVQRHNHQQAQPQQQGCFSGILHMIKPRIA